MVPDGAPWRRGDFGALWGVRILITLLLLLLAPASALACPTCGTALVPGMGAAGDLSGGYPLQYERSGSRLELEGARDRVIRFDTQAKADRLEVYVAGDVLKPATVAAGFSWQATRAIDLHICGPEVTLSLRLP